MDNQYTAFFVHLRSKTHFNNRGSMKYCVIIYHFTKFAAFKKCLFYHQMNV